MAGERSRHSAWTYKGPGTTTNGLQKAQLKAIPSTPGKYKFSVKGKNGNYAVNQASLPLVGTIDSRRAEQIMEVLLGGISQRRARVVIMDITGVPVVDSGIADHSDFQVTNYTGEVIYSSGQTDSLAVQYAYPVEALSRVIDDDTFPLVTGVDLDGLLRGTEVVRRSIMSGIELARVIGRTSDGR